MKTATIVLLAVLLISACTSVPQTIHVVERATSDVVTDTGATGDSVGDILTFANQLYDATNENSIGTDNGYCFRTVVASTWECNWTITLEEGQITVEGPFFDAADSALAITGGTGAYKNARGEMQLKARNAEGTEFDFIYEIYRY
ncbi:MAG: dirigent protein [Caldilineaceae bacterium]